MPWAYYHGFTDELEAKIDGLERFASEVLSQFPDPHARLRDRPLRRDQPGW